MRGPQGDSALTAQHGFQETLMNQIIDEMSGVILACRDNVRCLLRANGLAACPRTGGKHSDGDLGLSCQAH